VLSAESQGENYWVLTAFRGFANLKGWRLPNRNELESLVKLYQTPSPAAIDPSYFPNTSTSYDSTITSTPTQVISGILIESR
jgi:hypothetical protein